jgi:filamentous hemagglutinin family protein
MNHVYRLIWNHVSSAWVAVAETGRSRGKAANGKGTSRKLKIMAAANLSLCIAIAHATPVDGQVIAGTGSVSQSGSTTTILQSSQNLSLNWKSFNIAPQETVNFVQPSAAAIAVNRIFDTNGTQILGQLNADGQVYLINPNGVLFGQGAQVNVGALVASTLDLNDASLSSNTRAFSGNGNGSVVNQGIINAAKGGYVALLGNSASNQGTITAPQGTVALGAGSAATLTFQNNSLVQMQVDQGVLNSLAENGGLIRADGGMVILNAGAKTELLASVVNNTGVIEARTVDNQEGTIILLAGMAAGKVNVGGTLDASAPNGGNGGFIETSGANVNVADGTTITATAPYGKFGTWLLEAL